MGHKTRSNMAIETHTKTAFLTANTWSQVEVREAVKEQVSAVAQLQAQCESLRGAEEARASLEGRVAELQGQVMSLREASERSEAEVAGLSAQNTSLSQDYTHLEAQAEALVQELESTQELKLRAENEVAAVSTEKTACEAEILELEHNKAKLQDELKALQHHCHIDLAQHIVTLVADKEASEQNNKSLTAEVKTRSHQFLKFALTAPENK